MCAALIILAACPRCSEELSEGAVIHSGPCDPQAMEMATYPMDEWLRWEREHHGGRGDGTVGPNAHTDPVEDCPICRWGCQVAGCACESAARVRDNERSHRGTKPTARKAGASPP